ncbi:hypothetical protein AB9K41_25335, partial [Cribrihabitans sp. XS_ASV171]
MTDQNETLTLPEVAKLARVLSDTLRVWYRRGYLTGSGGRGWKRFDFREAAQVMMYAAVVRATKDHEIANRAVEAFNGHMAERIDGLEGDGLWLVCYRTELAYSDEEKAVQRMRSELGGDSPAGPFLQVEEISQEDQALKLLAELLRGELADEPRPICPMIIP